MVSAVDARLNAEGGSNGGRDGVLGDVLALLAAALYACYTVTLRVTLPDGEEEGVMVAFFGYLGAINLVVFTPVLALLKLSGRASLLQIGSVPIALAFLKGAHHREAAVAQLPRQHSVTSGALCRSV